MQAFTPNVTSSFLLSHSVVCLVSDFTRKDSVAALALHFHSFRPTFSLFCLHPSGASSRTAELTVKSKAKAATKFLLTKHGTECAKRTEEEHSHAVGKTHSLHKAAFT